MRAEQSFLSKAVFTQDSFCAGTPTNGDVGAISVTERSYAALTSKVKGHRSDRCLYYAEG